MFLWREDCLNIVSLIDHVEIMFKQFIEDNKLPNSFKTTAEDYYVPLIGQIRSLAESSEKPVFVGVNGCQGSGKSTFVDFVEHVLTTKEDLNVLVMSLDDFYYSSDTRYKLGKDIHPLFVTRGVPGTHKIDTLLAIITQLKTHDLPMYIPRFDKATDNPKPFNQWPLIDTVPDVVLIEGWCWGVPAQEEHELATPVNSLELNMDKNAIWRSHVNHELFTKYQPLYPLMDYWVCLKAPSIDCVYEWRLEQEQKLQERVLVNGTSKNAIMDAQQIKQFIDYFTRLTQHSFSTIGETADAILELDIHRKVERLILNNSGGCI